MGRVVENDPEILIVYKNLYKKEQPQIINRLDIYIFKLLIGVYQKTKLVFYMIDIIYMIRAPIFLLMRPEFGLLRQK